MEKKISSYENIFGGLFVPYLRDGSLIFKCSQCNGDAVIEERKSDIHEYVISHCDFGNFSFGDSVYNDLISFS